MKDAWNKFKTVVYFLTIMFVLLSLRAFPVEGTFGDAVQRMYDYIRNLIVR